MAVKQFGENSDSAFGRNVGKPDQPAMGNIFRENDPAEIGVDGDEDASFLGSPFQEHPVTWVCSSLPRLDHVVAPIPKPLGKPSPGAPIDQKPHP